MWMLPDSLLNTIAYIQGDRTVMLERRSSGGRKGVVSATTTAYGVKNGAVWSWQKFSHPPMR